jgi:Peptidase inhibitor family I36
VTNNESYLMKFVGGLIAVAAAACATEMADPDNNPADTAIGAQMQALMEKYPDAEPISDHELAWNDGSVVLSLPADEGDAPVGVDKEALCVLGQGSCAVHNCPSGWYCFYQNDKFGGRMLKFRDCPSGGGTQYLTDYGFENKTTSWVVNRKLSLLNVNDQDGNRGFPPGFNLWNAHSYSQSSNVGSTNNDRADWFICYGN